MAEIEKLLYFSRAAVLNPTFGDVMYNHDFDDNTLRSYSDKLNKSTLSTSAKEYGVHFSESKPVGAVNNLFEDAFNKAFVEYSSNDI